MTIIPLKNLGRSLRKVLLGKQKEKIDYQWKKTLSGTGWNIPAQIKEKFTIANKKRKNSS